jgi:hypothetical protein
MLEEAIREYVRMHEIDINEIFTYHIKISTLQDFIRSDLHAPCPQQVITNIISVKFLSMKNNALKHKHTVV